MGQASRCSPPCYRVGPGVVWTEISLPRWRINSSIHDSPSRKSTRCSGPGEWVLWGSGQGERCWMTRHLVERRMAQHWREHKLSYLIDMRHHVIMCKHIMTSFRMTSCQWRVWYHLNSEYICVDIISEHKQTHVCLWWSQVALWEDESYTSVISLGWIMPVPHDV